ncbi:MAG: hypothetical protein HUJ58_04555, partial [Erysipelotrichaceae bacterium]|nr:hypothetical protein [Erysipelotrichaceae bacterium]
MKVRSIPEQNRIMDICAKERIDTIIPEIMKQRNVECWLVASKEYHEDLIFPAITPGNYLTARRVTMMVFILKNDEYHKFSLSLPDKGLSELYEPYWNFGKETQEEALNRLLEEYDPANICLNTSKNYTFSDGLSMGLYQWLQEVVNPKY